MAAGETFTQEAWKTNIAERLQHWRSRLQQQGAPSVYAFLSAATLWPVVEAARGGDWAALTVLGGILAGVGNNVLANRLQQWRDEADAAWQIAADIAADPALQAEPVWLNNCAGSRRIAIVIAQESYQAFATPDLTGLPSQVWLGCHEPVSEALMVALGMIVGKILVDHIKQRWFPQHHHVTKRSLFDRAHEPFAVRVQIWAPRC
jgi:hypothetical protein